MKSNANSFPVSGWNEFYTTVDKCAANGGEVVWYRHALVGFKQLDCGQRYISRVGQPLLVPARSPLAARDSW